MTRKTAAAARQLAADVATLCTYAGESHAAEHYIRQGLTLDEVKARLDNARAIRAMVLTARRINRSMQVDPAQIAGAIRLGVPAVQVGQQLWAQAIADDPPEINSHRAEEAPGANDPAKVAARQKRQAAAGWDRAARIATGGIAR